MQILWATTIPHKTTRIEAKKTNTIEVHVLLAYNSKTAKNDCFNANSTTYDMAL